jgi:hypothetical protein
MQWPPQALTNPLKCKKLLLNALSTREKGLLAPFF